MNLRIVIFVIVTLIKLCKWDDLIIAKQDIVHPTTELILQYKSDYRPANKIVTLSTVIPMVADMCYLILISAFKKIHRCNLTSHVMNFINHDVMIKKRPKVMNRNKRFLTYIISMNVSTVALSLSIMNPIQKVNLNQEVKTVTETVETL